MDLFNSLLVIFLLLYSIAPSVSSVFVTKHLELSKTGRYEISANTSMELIVDVTDDSSISFIVLQAHSQKYPFVASLNESVDYYDNAMKSTNPGLVVDGPVLKYGTVELFLMSELIATQVVEAMAIAYPSYSPIPGGCCLTCDVAIDPSLNVSFNPWYTKIRFQLGNSGYDAMDGDPTLCEGGGGFTYLTYQLYLYRFGEMSYDEDLALDAWQKMATVDAVKSYGTEVGSLLSFSDVKLVTVSSQPGQGVVYNVLVHDPKHDLYAAYVPYITYGCSFTAKVDGCDAAGSVLTKVVLSIAGVAGLIFCFAGHRLFPLVVCVAGFLYFVFLSFILLSDFVNWSHDVRVGVSAVLGVVGSLLFFFVFFRFYLVLAFVLLHGIILGFVFSSILFFSPFGDLSFWQNLLDYWIAFVCGMLFPAVVLLMWPRTLNIVATAVVGSYAFIVGVNSYIQGVLSYIVLDIIKKAVMPTYVSAYTDYPFEMPDIILASVWGVLAISGIIFQMWRERKDKRPALPPWLYRKWKESRLQYRELSSRSRESPGERRRLLETAGTASVSSYGSLSDNK